MDEKNPAPHTAVFSDIDGTLLNSEHRVTPRTRRAIAQKKEDIIMYMRRSFDSVAVG